MGPWANVSVGPLAHGWPMVPWAHWPTGPWANEIMGPVSHRLMDPWPQYQNRSVPAFVLRIVHLNQIDLWLPWDTMGAAVGRPYGGKVESWDCLRPQLRGISIGEISDPANCTVKSKS